MTRSKEQKTPIIKDSIISTAIRNSLNLFLMELLIDKIQRGVINVVNKINRIEIPSTPTL